jgi:hypothetical protein
MLDLPLALLYVTKYGCILKLRELPIGGQNADLGGVFVTSFGEGVHHVAPAFPEIS